MGSVLIDRDCSTVGCWTQRAEVLWAVTLSRLSEESRSVSQPTGMLQAWGQARKAVKSDQVRISKVHEQPQAQLQSSQAKDPGQEAEQNQNPWVREGLGERHLPACSHTVLHSNTATLHQSSAPWAQGAKFWELWEAVQPSMSEQTCMLPLCCGLSLWGTALTRRDTCSDWSLKVFCSPVYTCSDEFNTSPGTWTALHTIFQGKIFFFSSSVLIKLHRVF